MVNGEWSMVLRVQQKKGAKLAAPITSLGRIVKCESLCGKKRSMQPTYVWKTQHTQINCTCNANTTGLQSVVIKSYFQS